MLVPVPAAQVVPPSVLNSQVAPSSRPLTATLPSLVMPSDAPLPVSLARASVAAAGPVRSTVIADVSDAAVLLFPAPSVWRTCTAPAA